MTRGNNHGLLTKADAAQILELTPASVISLEKKGVLSAIRTKGGIRLFREEEVLQLAVKRGREREKRERRAQ